MKNILRYACALLVVLTLGACGDKKSGDDPAPGPVVPPDPDAITVAALVGQWHLTGWSVESEFAGDAYLEIRIDATFDLYQTMGAPGYARLSGIFTLDGKTGAITGRYDDDTPWGAAYTIRNLTADRMEWAVEGAVADDVSVFERTPIPDHILKGSRAGMAFVGPRLL